MAGDSAHVHSPAGGQGLNTGLQDAYNLAWKMGMVINGTAPPSLLDSYEEERPAIADEIIKLTVKTLDQEFGHGNMFKRAVKRAFITLAPIIMPLTSKGSPPAAMVRLKRCDKKKPWPRELPNLRGYFFNLLDCPLYCLCLAWSSVL